MAKQISNAQKLRNQIAEIIIDKECGQLIQVRNFADKLPKKGER